MAIPVLKTLRLEEINVDLDRIFGIRTHTKVALAPIKTGFRILALSSIIAPSVGFV